MPPDLPDPRNAEILVHVVVVHAANAGGVSDEHRVGQLPLHVDQVVAKRFDERPLERLDVAFVEAGDVLRQRGELVLVIGDQAGDGDPHEHRAIPRHAEATEVIPAVGIQEAAEGAKAGCPISRLLNTKITLDAKLA